MATNKARLERLEAQAGGRLDFIAVVNVAGMTEAERVAAIAAKEAEAKLAHYAGPIVVVDL